MPRACCVPDCNNSNVKGSSVRFYRFPRNSTQRAAWIKAVDRESFAPTMYTVLCEKHFLPSDFITTATRTDVLTGKVIEVGLKSFRLKPSAAPSVFPSSSNVSRPTTSTSEAREDTHLKEDQWNKVMWEHPVCEFRSTTPAASSTKMVQADLVKPTVDVAIGPSHSICGVSSSTQVLNVTLDMGTQTCSSFFDDAPVILARPRQQGFSCDRCNKVFYTQDILNAHQCKHRQCPPHDGKRYKECKHYQCPQQNEKKYSCAYCSYSSFKRNAVVIHERTHTGERPHVCHYCLKAFTLHKLLRRHLLRAHTIEGPFKCSECGASFFRKTGLKQHDLAIHVGKRPAHSLRKSSGNTAATSSMRETLAFLDSSLHNMAEV